MFGLFKKKTPLEQLQAKHAQLLKESFELSTSNRQAADLKAAKASEVADEIVKLLADKNR